MNKEMKYGMGGKHTRQTRRVANTPNLIWRRHRPTLAYVAFGAGRRPALRPPISTRHAPTWA